MLTNRLLKLTILAGITVAGLGAQAADQPSGSTSAAAARQPATTDPAANRPLTAKDVWGHDYTQAKQQAKKLNRPVLLHFHATWCGPCQQMERTVLNTPGILKELNSRCVAIKVDSDQHPNLVQQFGVDSLPCDVFVNSDGKVLKVNQGAISAEQYKAMIATVARPKAGTPAGVEVTSN